MAKSTVTIRDVARRAGVSIATVSYVLNESAPVSEPTRVRVLAAAAELGYHPSVIARGLRTRESRTIGYSWHSLPADRWHPILDRFLFSIAEAAKAHGYHILTFSPGRDKDPLLSYEELMHSGRVDGFILCETNKDDARICRLLDSGFPFVAFGRANETWDFCSVDVDGKAGVRQAVEHLLSLGHHRIGLIAWSESSLSGYHRYQGYIQALEDAHITPHPDWVVRGEHAEPSGREAMRILLDLPPGRRPSAVVAVSDLMAIGAMNGIYEAGLQPGRDVAVIGFDDMPAAQYYRPPLTTVHQPIAEVGGRVIDMLLRIIRGEEIGERKVLLKPQLIVRSSSGRAI